MTCLFRSLGEGLLVLALSRLRIKQCGGRHGWEKECVMKKDLLLLRKKKELKTRAGKNRYPIRDQNGGKMAEIDTLFMTKTAEKPYPLGPHIPI